MVKNIEQENQMEIEFDYNSAHMVIFTEKLKGKKKTVIGLAGIADLYVSVDGG